MTAQTTYQYSHTIGLASLAKEGFLYPVDMAIDSQNRLYVVNRGITFKQLDIKCMRVSIASPDGDYLDQFGGWGHEDGQFEWPTGIACDRTDHVYVTDISDNRLQVFSQKGDFLGKWGTAGDRDGEWNRPTSLAFDREDNLYVSDTLNCRIQKFTKEGKFLLKWGEKGTGDGQFDMPWGIALDAAGDVYVADWRNDRIQKFDAQGKFLMKFGQSGDGEGEFHRPSGVAVDTAGNIWVSDWGNHRAQVFSPDGSFLAQFRGDATLSNWAVKYLEANQDYVQGRKIAKSLDPEKWFYSPTAVKTDGAGRVYVVDSNRHRLQIYRPAS